MFGDDRCEWISGLDFNDFDFAVGDCELEGGLFEAVDGDDVGAGGVGLVYCVVFFFDKDLF